MTSKLLEQVQFRGDATSCFSQTETS